MSAAFESESQLLGVRYFSSDPFETIFHAVCCISTAILALPGKLGPGVLLLTIFECTRERGGGAVSKLAHTAMPHY